MNRTLPGTHNNFERCGDRDLYWSMLLRFPTPGRSLDADTFPEIGPQILCGKCHLPKLLMESVRGDIDYKHTYITEAWATRLGCPAFVVSHTGQWFPAQRMKSKVDCEADWGLRKPSMFFKVEARPAGVVVFEAYEGDVEEFFLQWVEEEMGSHRCPR